ncbi:MAG: hypothetical protein Q4D81_04430 [Eubacteriales bacterium]|nr:hypothetical protein [Eubacteriales bacterium]
MAKSDLTELEARLYQCVTDQRKMSEDIAGMVNDRNRSRIAEKEKDEKAARTRSKLVVIGIFVVGAAVAYFYYKATFGMF